MLKKLIQKKKLILIVFAAVLLVLWTVTLIFGNAESKTAILVLSLIIPFVTYGFMRLMFKVVRINAPLKYMKFIVRFFLIAVTLGLIMMLVEFAAGFPNGFSPTLSACMGVIIGALDEEKKNIQIESEK